MTKDQALVFLTDAGHVVDVEEFDETHACVGFKYRGSSIKLFTNYDDPDFLFMICSYSLLYSDLDELAISKIVADVQLNLKVVKLHVDLEGRYVAASAEQFLPECEGFAPIFWRSADLVIHAARKATHDIHAQAAVGDAAERFTSQMEAELHTNGDS